MEAPHLGNDQVDLLLMKRLLQRPNQTATGVPSRQILDEFKKSYATCAESKHDVKDDNTVVWEKDGWKFTEGDRQVCGEFFFDPQRFLNDYDDSIITLAQLLYRTWKKCAIDSRKQLGLHITLTGQAKKIPNFKNRLGYEMRCLSYGKCLRARRDEHFYKDSTRDVGPGFGLLRAE
eukprot:TRINITY_DN5351_c0_g1_i1.p1 TRINITY_DN5351_c0_g1~~TRINITY_DN5351_c0_g1_i1.p1  ORF type:complete len:203 (+),score=25.15 TRINITY_DN5351_c0_g1_i1:82-609(+)